MLNEPCVCLAMDEFNGTMYVVDHKFVNSLILSRVPLCNLRERRDRPWNNLEQNKALLFSCNNNNKRTICAVKINTENAVNCIFFYNDATIEK